MITRDEVISMAREAGFSFGESNRHSLKLKILVSKAYAKGVAAERERCAKVCDRLVGGDTTCRGDLPDLNQFANAIRVGAQP